MCHVLNNVCMHCADIISRKVILCDKGKTGYMCLSVAGYMFLNQDTDVASLLDLFTVEDDKAYIDVTKCMDIVTVENKCLNPRCVMDRA
jgi:hypothetical protein